MGRTIKQFIEEFQDVQRDMLRDYTNPEDSERPGILPPCHMMHRDLDLGATQPDDAEERAAALEERIGITVRPDDLDLTIEHRQLHEVLRQAQLQMTLGGMHAAEMLASMFTIGRRMGLREAAASFDFDGIPTLEEHAGESQPDPRAERPEDDTDEYTDR